MTLPLNRILHGNCIEILNSLPENSVDLVFADPPYNLQLQNDLYRPNNTKVDAVNNKWDKFSSFAKYDEFTLNWLHASRRVLKETGTIWVIGSYHNIFRVGAVMQDLGFWILNDVIWLKTNPMPNFRGVRFTNAHETLIWAQKQKGAKYKFNHKDMKALNEDLQMRSDWVIPLATGKERIKANGTKAHPTQKPEALLYRILLASTDVGDVVLDPFFGSGTTGAVAKMMGRRFIGIERDKKYIRIAEKRIAAVKSAPAEGLILPTKQKQVRVPFGALIENGYLKIGQRIKFAKGKREAVILANGHIKCGKLVGSIHKVASELSKAPANGWEMWMYTERGKLKSINELREKFRQSLSLAGRG